MWRGGIRTLFFILAGVCNWLAIEKEPNGSYRARPGEE